MLRRVRPDLPGAQLCRAFPAEDQLWGARGDHHLRASELCGPERAGVHPVTLPGSESVWIFRTETSRARPREGTRETPPYVQERGARWPQRRPLWGHSKQHLWCQHRCPQQAPTVMVWAELPVASWEQKQLYTSGKSLPAPWSPSPCSQGREDRRAESERWIPPGEAGCLVLVRGSREWGP